VVIRADRIVKLLEQSIKFLLVAQRKANGQVQTLRVRKIAGGSQTRHRRWDVAAAESLKGRRAAGQGPSQRQ